LEASLEHIFVSGTFTSPPRWEFCISETIRFFPHSSDFLLAENNFEKRRQIKGSGIGADPKLILVSKTIILKFMKES
jgi:hypothetical protein